MFPDQNTGINFVIRFFGTLGVDIFFILSGFLIGSILINQIEGGKTDLRHFSYFWIRRWFKTLPNYFLILLINILLLNLIWDLKVEGLWKYFFFLQNFSTDMPDFFTESWSLSIEEFSYIIGPAALWLLLIIKLKTKRAFLVVTLALIILGIIARLYFHQNVVVTDFKEWSHSLRKVVIYRIDSIYYGFLGAYVSIYFLPSWRKMRIYGIFLGALIFLSLHLPILMYDLNPVKNTIYFNTLYLPTLLISILCVFPYFSTLKGATAVLRDKFFNFRNVITYISKTSYALYLVNYSIVFLLLQHYIDISDLETLKKVALLVIYWILSFLFSHLLYTYFEKPIMNLRNRPFFRNLTKD